MIGLGLDPNPSKSVYIYTWIKCSEEKEKKTGKVKFQAPSGAEDNSYIGGGNQAMNPEGYSLQPNR